MILVDILDEGLNTCSFYEFLLIIASLDLRQVTSNACNQKMRESMFLNKLFLYFISLFVGLNDNGLLSSKSSLCNNDDSTDLETRLTQLYILPINVINN